jgi:6-phosphogluconolactonase
VRGAAGVVVLPHLRLAAAQPRRFAYVACGRGTIDVFSLAGDAWTPTQRVPSRAPACVLLSPTQKMLYVCNDIDVHEGLPRGTVETFRIDPLDGRLTLSVRTPLSLSATRPRHMALSPDGKLLAVAAYGGGIYNLLPIAEDGSLGQPCGIFKDAGCGLRSRLQESAHPHTVLFDGSGRHLLCSDFGSDRLSVFAVEDGRLQRQMRRSTDGGSGPGACALHPDGVFFYAWHHLEGVLACYRYDHASGIVGEAFQRLPQYDCAGSHALALNPSGRRLYTTHEARNELKVWRIDPENGMLSHRQDLSLGEANPTQIIVTRDGLYILDGPRGSIYRVNAERSTANVAVVNEPKSLAIKTG